MCKKICAIFGVVAVLTAAVLIGLPGYYAMHGRQYIENAVQTFNIDQNIRAEITRFSNHWFSSNADVTITITGKSGHQLNIVNRIHAVYGPLMIVKTMDNKTKLAIGKAFLTFATALPAPNSFIKFNGPLLKGQIFISLQDNVTTTIQGLTFQSQNPTMTLNGITWQSQTQADKQQINLTIGTFNKQGENFSLVTQPITITQDLSNSPRGIGLGNLTIRVPSISGELSHSKFDYKNILIKAILDQQNNNLNTSLTANIDNYQSNNSTGTSAFSFKLENLNAQAYTNYSKTMQETLKYGVLNKKEILQVISQYMPQFFQKTTRLFINISDRNNKSGNTKISFTAHNQNNNLMSTAEMDWDNLILNNQSNLLKTHFSIENLNAATLGKIMDKLGSMGHFSASGEPKKSDLEIVQTALLLPQVVQSNTQGRLTAQIISPQYGNFDCMSADIQFANVNGIPNPLASLQALILNVTFTVPKTLMDTLLSQDLQTLRQSTPLFLHMFNVGDTDKFNKLKQYFAYWQQQGYITTDGTNYISRITIANKETLVNGKIYQPLQQAQAQVSLNQSVAPPMVAQAQQNVPQPQPIQYPPAGQLPQPFGPQFHQPPSQQPSPPQQPGIQQPSQPQQTPPQQPSPPTMPQQQQPEPQPLMPQQNTTSY